MTKPDWQLIMEMKKLFQILWKSQEEKKRQKQKKRIKQFFFKFENKVLQKTGTLWSNHRLLIKQKQGNEKSVQVHTGLININIILHIYMCYLSCFTMVNILLIVYLQFEIWHHFIFGSRLYCVFFQHGVQIYQSSILHSGTDTWLNNLIDRQMWRSLFICNKIKICKFLFFLQFVHQFRRELTLSRNVCLKNR